jgi:hypothetical protein
LLLLLLLPATRAVRFKSDLPVNRTVPAAAPKVGDDLLLLLLLLLVGCCWLCTCVRVQIIHPRLLSHHPRLKLSFRGYAVVVVAGSSARGACVQQVARVRGAAGVQVRPIWR